MRFITPFLVLGAGMLLLGGSTPAPSFSTHQPRELCEIFGYIRIVEGNSRADYTYYVEESEFSADYVVFWEESPLYADVSGHWYKTDDPYEAFYTLKEIKNPNRADFIVYFTEYEHRAGCP